MNTDTQDLDLPVEFWHIGLHPWLWGFKGRETNVNDALYSALLLLGQPLYYGNKHWIMGVVKLLPKFSKPVER